jgi:hypothetical protein
MSASTFELRTLNPNNVVHQLGGDRSQIEIHTSIQIIDTETMVGRVHVCTRSVII